MGISSLFVEVKIESFVYSLFTSQGAVLNSDLTCIFLQELRMYNPQYLERPYVVVLNKIDLPKVHFTFNSLI